MDKYIELKNFWDSNFKDLTVEVINEKWITDDKFNEITNKYINENTNVLDYGCGSGWALFEAYNTVKFSKGIGIDTSENAIKYNNMIAKISKMENIDFICGDESKLKQYENYFDFVYSFNVFDVLPDEIIKSILVNLKKSLKPNAHLFIGLNPDFTIEELTNLLKMEEIDGYYFKNGIMRCNKKSIEKWKEIFNEYFNIIEDFKFAIVEQEQKYPRVGFLLENY